MKKRIVLLIFILLPLTLLAEDAVQPVDSEDAETEESFVYVTDRLRLSLFREEGSKGGKIKTLTTGDKLTLLEETGRYMRVKTEDDDEGWVTKLYIVSEAPATLRVKELETQLQLNEQTIEDLKKTRKEKGVIKPGLQADYERQLIKTNEENVQLFNEKEQYRKKLDQAGLEITRLTHKLDNQGEYEGQTPLTQKPVMNYPPVLWIAIAATTGWLLGMIWGYRLYARKIKKRFHGFEI